MPEDFRNIQEGLSIYVKAGTLVFLSLAGLFLFFIVSSIQRKRRLLARQKEIQHRHSEAILQTQLEIQEQTLRTISQEIHDNVGQVLSLAKINLQSLHIDTGISRDEKIEKSADLVSKAINDLRDLSRSLHADKITDLGLQEAIDNELKIIQNTGLITTRLGVTGRPYPLPGNQELVIFRMLQEALHNAVKHSRATNIAIEIHYTANSCNIVVADDGVGFDTSLLQAADTGIGLRNMQRRAALIDASMFIESAPGKGTKVLITSTHKPNNNG